MKDERLLRLADYLEHEVRPKQFDMDYWWHDTVGCAVGHACQITEFRDAGLTLRTSGAVEFPRYRRSSGYNAAKQFFGLTNETTRDLFCPLQYSPRRPRPRAVAGRIRKVVAGADV